MGKHVGVHCSWCDCRLTLGGFCVHVHGEEIKWTHLHSYIIPSRGPDDCLASLSLGELASCSSYQASQSQVFYTSLQQRWKDGRLPRQHLRCATSAGPGYTCLDAQSYCSKVLDDDMEITMS